MANPDYKTEPARIIRYTEGGMAEIETASGIEVVANDRLLVRDGKIQVKTD